VLLWCPTFVDRVTVEQLAAVLVHEVGHVLRDHSGRCKMLSANPKLWNIAGDAEINDDLRDDWDLPDEGGVQPEKLGLKPGLTAEEYYANLRQEMEKQAGDEGDESGEGDGSGEDGDGGGSEDGQETKSGSGKGKGQGGKKKSKGGTGTNEEDKPSGPAKGWCGSGAGRALPGEPSESEEAGKSQSDLERLRNEVAEAIKREASQGRGTVPAGWQRWAEEWLQPAKIPWRQKLARIVRGAVAFKSGAVDLTYRKRSRRQAGVGYGPGAPILPAYHAPVPKVECWLDTSGSMGGDEVKRGLSEINGVLKATGAEVVFGACDAAVHSRGAVRRWQDLVPMVKGGGGTDFRPIFEEVSKPSRRFQRPDVLIFCTDGCGPAPEHPPVGMVVIWVLIGKYKKTPATWGEVIEVEEGE
jgi:predicted metal-dependent peptidase